jgi:uncharacterized protein (TIGR03437 family)
VWYSEDGEHLFAKTHSGRTFQTDDFERWSVVPAVAPQVDDNVPAVSKPEPAAKLRVVAGSTRLFGLGTAAYRSDDGGVTWTNLTRYRGDSLLGPALLDLATSPRDADEVVVAASTGVWRSLDGGLSWTGLNDLLPNLPVTKIYGLPAGTHGVRLGLSSDAPEVEWAPGEKSAWQVVDSIDALREQAVKAALSEKFSAVVSAVGGSGSYVYAGSADGQLWSSGDKGVTWTGQPDRPAGPIEAIYVNPKDPRIAIATVGARNAAANPNTKLPHVLRTMNGGIFWDDISANLADLAVHGVTADPSSGAVYIASEAGVFLTETDLTAAGRATNWTSVGDQLPKVAATDVRLDSGGNQLFVALDGQGVYVTIAPHRRHDARLVNAADYSQRAASPGGLLSVIGTRVQSAQTSDSRVPVLDANDIASQIQVPFDATGSEVSLALDAPSGRVTLGLPLQSVSPAIFVNPDGSPWILDADSGVLLDSSKPARAKSKIQILATGLGQVTPDWPAGMAAPLSDPPRVRANVRVYLDRVPLEITRATLAPGYIGSYLIEAAMPAIVNNGPAELYIEADDQPSNHVRIYIQQ